MGLTDKQQAFLEWFVTPSNEKKFPTQQALAEYLGVREETIVHWKKRPEIKEVISTAAMDWGNDQLPKIINALFAYAQTPAGDKDRMTIIRYFMPQLLKAKSEGEFDKLQPAGNKAKQISQELALSYLEDCSAEEQQKFMLILSAMGAVAQPDQQEAEPYQVRRNEEDIIDIPQLTAAPGRPRGSRKVRLKRPQE